MTTSVSTLFDLPRLQGRQVIHIVDMKVNFDIQGMTVQFDNLFNGNEVLGKCNRVQPCRCQQKCRDVHTLQFCVARAVS